MRTRILAAAAGVAALLVIGVAVYLFSPPRPIAGTSIPVAGPPIVGGATYVTTSSSVPSSTSVAVAPTSGQPSSTAGIAQPPPAAPPPAALPTRQASPNASGQITFYGAADNDPPGSREIAYPGVRHGQAGGTGTFDDPITFAAQNGRFAPGTRIYVPDVRRYFILEDSCAGCSGSHVDLWAGSANDRGIVRCEDSLTRSGSRPYQLNPPAGLAVSPGDLYQNGHCFRG